MGSVVEVMTSNANHCEVLKSVLMLLALFAFIY